jgi:NitT/TauT family transport system permease protein
MESAHDSKSTTDGDAGDVALHTVERGGSADDTLRPQSAGSGDAGLGGKPGAGTRLVELGRRSIGLLSVALFVLVWHVIAAAIRSPYLPEPAAVARALVESVTAKDFLGYTIGQHTMASLTRIIYGFSVAVVLAVPLGLWSGWFKTVAALTTPIVEILRPIPPLAWIPFAIYFFGSPYDALFLVVLAGFFPVFLNTHAGVRGIQPVLVDAARTLGARGSRLFTDLVLPAAMGHVITGARIGLGIAWMSIVAAEMVGVKGGGLGVYIWSMAEVGRFDAVFAGMILIGLLGMLLTGAMGLVERRFGYRGTGDA